MGAFQAGGGCAPPVPASRWSPPAGATALRCPPRVPAARCAPRHHGRATSSAEAVAARAARFVD